MFCKFCGETIDRRTMKCSSCGKSVGPLAGGVGFWDLAGQPAQAAPAAPAAPVVNPGEMEQLQGRNPINHKNGKQPAPKKLPILSVLALLLALVLLVMIILIRGDIRTLNRNYEALEQKYEELEQKYEEVSGERGRLEQMVSDMWEKNDENAETQNGESSNPTDPSNPTGESSNPTGESSNPTGESSNPTGESSNLSGDPSTWIIKQPKNEPVTSDKRYSGQPIVLFELRLANDKLTYQWEKWDEEANTWREVDTKRYRVDTPPIEEGVCVTLTLERWSEDACGKYRCRITDENGTKIYSDEASVYMA